MSNLRNEIIEHFMSSKLGSRKLTGYDGDYRTYTVKDSGFFGVAIFNREQKEINEKFENAEIKSVLITEDNGETNSFILLTSNHQKEKIKFSYICEDFIKLGKDNYYREKILGEPVTWWEEWRQLIGDTQSNKEPYSVVAELWVYNKELEKGNLSISWEGSKAKNHDFESELYNVEVKSSTAQFSELITISNHYQLEHDNDLHLMYLILQENIDGISINEMVNQLTKKGIDIDLIEKNLTSLGYPRGNNARNESYKILEVREYIVDENFPKINSESFKGNRIPLGVKKISYTLDLAGLEYVKIDSRLEYMVNKN